MGSATSSLDSPERFDDVAAEFERKNLTKSFYIIWTDYERVDFMNFRWKDFPWYKF